MKAKEKGELLEDIANSKIDIVVGTHALLQENVSFNDLGLIIIELLIIFNIFPFLFFIIFFEMN